MFALTCDIGKLIFDKNIKKNPSFHNYFLDYSEMTESNLTCSLGFKGSEWSEEEEEEDGRLRGEKWKERREKRWQKPRAEGQRVEEGTDDFDFQ